MRLHPKLKNVSIPRSPLNIFFLSFFLIIIADGTMSYVFPIVVEDSLSSNTLMGIIMALSSITGLICDFIFPSLISRKNSKQLLIACALMALLFPVLSYFGELFNLVGFFVLASIAWGVYYEFLAFSQQNYIIESDKTKNFTKDWGLLAVLISMMEVIAPILGSTLLVAGGLAYPVAVLLMLSVALVILMLQESKSEEDVEIKSVSRELVKLIKEFKMWDLLYGRVWQVLLVSFVLQSVFATYWTFGGLFGQQLVGEEGMDWIVIVLYAIPSLIASLLLSKFMIKKNKKKLTQIFLIFGGLILTMLVFARESVYLTGLLILLSSLMFAFAYPLNNAVFSDLGARLGKEKNHLFGMMNAIGSLAFIMIPIALGVLSDTFGYIYAFAFTGAFSMIAGTLLIIKTPRKIRLPQKEIQSMD
ncbi:MAG TPA: MFS transporter [Candidatus Dojkabacteria bacterium]|nr:MFS transporter [Candidatus Dojkabacteria bacterium]HRP37306.1 MFS transporter [Candidatus Dojkabacteria bacterium]HRP51113.1 MFS transporter [Candidatus Dojkabacteria bacterium]